MAKIRDTELSWIVYVQEMIDLIDDGELAKKLGVIHADKMNICGIGLFGSKDELKELTGSLQLWR